jgi:Putative MetA-pathway of phenol degradation
MKRACFLVLLVLLLSGRSYAFDVLGLQPVAPNGVFSTFATDTVPKNKWAVEMGFEKSKEPSFARFDLRAAYGINQSLEFDISVPYVYHFSDSADGVEDVAIGFKHRFYDEGKYGPSLAYIINASVPSGREQFSTRGRFGGGFIVSKRVGPFEGHLNFFYEKPGTGSLKDEISFLSGIEFSASHNFKLLGELIVRKSHDSNEYDQLEPRFGYRLRTGDSFYTTVGIGGDFKRREPEYRVLLSVSYMPTREKKVIKRIFEEE